MKKLIVLFIIFAVSSPAFSQTNRYDDYFRKYSKRFFGIGYDWKVFKAQAIAESNLAPDARSWVGAIGIMQLMPSTFKEIQSSNVDFSNINDPRWNIAAGIYYNRLLWKKWTDSETTTDKLCFMFGSYNAGLGTISKAKEKAKEEQLNHAVWQSIEIVAPRLKKWRYNETLQYVERIDNYYSKLSKNNGFKEFQGK